MDSNSEISGVTSSVIYQQPGFGSFDSDEWVAFKSDIFVKDTDTDKLNSFNGKISNSPKAANARVRERRRLKNLCSTNRTQFLVGYNQIDNIVAITFLEESRRVTHEQSNSFATSLRIEDLIELNNDLSLICSEVSLHFDSVREIISKITDQQSSLYFIRYLLGLAPTIEESQIEVTIQDYLNQAAQLCGKKLVKTLLFERHVLDDCEENSQQFQMQGFENWIEKCRRNLNGVLILRKKAPNLMTIVELYKLEDEAVLELRQALAELYLFQLGPFVLAREIAFDQIDNCQAILETSDFGDRIKRETKKVLEKCQNEYLISTEAIHQIYLDFYRENVELLKAQVTRAMEDQKNYGQNAFRLKGGLKRLKQIQLQCASEETKFLNCRKSIVESRLNPEFSTQFEFEKQNENKIYENNQNQLNFESTIELIDINMEILSKEERKYKLELAKFTGVETVDESELNEFYDTVESPEDFGQIEQEIDLKKMKQNQQINYWKKKLIKNAQKKALLRTKKLQLNKLTSNNNNNKKSDQSYGMLNRTNSSESLQSITSFKSVDSKLLPSRNGSFSASSSSSKKTFNDSNNRMKQYRKETLSRLRRFKMVKIMESDDNGDEDNKNDDGDCGDCSDSGLKDKSKQSANNNKKSPSIAFFIANDSNGVSPPPPPPPLPMSFVSSTNAVPSSAPPPPPPPPLGQSTI